MQEQTDNLNGDQTHNFAKQILYAGTNIINSEKKRTHASTNNQLKRRTQYAGKASKQFRKGLESKNI